MIKQCLRLLNFRNKIDTKKPKFIISRFLSYPLIQPQYFMIEITDYCNLKCIMCASNKCIGHMDYSLLINLFNQINNFSQEPKIIQLTGGEPLLHPRFKDLATYVKNNYNVFHLSSNGLLIDNFFEEIINYDLLNISIDGFKDANDLVRGKGIFDRIINNLKKLYCFIDDKGIHLEVCFNILITKYNYQGLYSLIKYLHEIYPYAKFQLLNVVKNNSQIDLGLDGDLGHIDKPLRLREEISKSKSYCQDNNLVFFYPEGYLNYLTNKQYSYWKCYAGYNRASISVNGDIWLCDTSLGNIAKEDLKTAWYSKKAWHFRKKVKQCRNYCFQDCYRYKNI